MREAAAAGTSTLAALDIELGEGYTSEGINPRRPTALMKAIRHAAGSHAQTSAATRSAMWGGVAHLGPLARFVRPLPPRHLDPRRMTRTEIASAVDAEASRTSAVQRTRHHAVRAARKDALDKAHEFANLP